MVVLLHKVEVPDSLALLNLFSSFSDVQLYKPVRSHASRSSFYLVASDIRATGEAPIRAVEEWKRVWRIATFGTEEEYTESRRKDANWARDLLAELDPTIIEKGKAVWNIQAEALEKAPYIRGK